MPFAALWFGLPQALGFMSVTDHQLPELVKVANDIVLGVEIPPNERIQASAACHDTAIEHAAAIALLMSAGLPAAAYAMLRVLFETSIKGTWLYRCATEYQLGRYLRGKDVRVKFGDMIGAIENQLGQECRQLSTLHRTSWNIMNGFTHGGAAQVLRRFCDGSMAAHFSEEEMVKCMNCAGVLCLLSAIELSSMCGLPEQSQRLLSVSKKFARH